MSEKNAYLQIKKIQHEPDKFGTHLAITMVGLYKEDGTWVKWVKLDGITKDLFANVKIPVKI